MFKILLLVLLVVLIKTSEISYCRNDPQLKNEAKTFIEKACRNMWVLKNAKMCYVKKVFGNYLSKYLSLNEKIDREIELFFWNVTDYEKSCDNNTDKRIYSIPKIKGLNYLTIYANENATIVVPGNYSINTFELDDVEYKKFIDFDGELYKKIMDLREFNYTEFNNYNETNLNNTRVNLMYSEIVFRNKIKYKKRNNETFVNDPKINTVLIINPNYPENETVYFTVTYHPIYNNEHMNLFDEDAPYDNYEYNKIDTENEQSLYDYYDDSDDIMNSEFDEFIF